MSRAIPRWLWEKYAILWKRHKTKQISFQHIKKVCPSHYSRIAVSMVIKDLKKAGWLTVKRNPKKQSTRLYTLVNPNKVVEGYK